MDYEGQVVVVRMNGAKQTDCAARPTQLRWPYYGVLKGETVGVP